MTTNNSPQFTKEQDLAQDVTQYLDALASGLAHDFPDEEFNHLKLLGRLGVVSRLYERAVRQYLNQFSLMPVESQVLVTIRSQVASSPAELASATQQTRAGMTSTLDRLEKRKLLKRVPHETDRRKTLIKLTKTGENLTSKLVIAQNEALQTIMQGSSATETKNLNQTLNRLINLLSQSE